MDARRIRFAAITIALLLGVWACVEQESRTAKSVKSYQGKPDAAAWEHPHWNGDRAAWEHAIAAREQNQNEYVRIPQ
jgi:hypothetical protein